MIKCPSCGSTAQVKQTLVASDFGAGGQSFHFYEYKCGCGARFEGSRYRSDVDESEIINYKNKNILVRFKNGKPHEYIDRGS